MFYSTKLIVFFYLFDTINANKEVYLTTLTPWCSNSFRIQIQPSPHNSKLYTSEYIQTRQRLSDILIKEGLDDLPGALIDECGPGAPKSPTPGIESIFSNGNLQVTVSADGTSISLSNVETSTSYFTAIFSLSPSINFTSYLSVTLNTTAGNKQERIYGLGQGGWTADCEGCPTLPPSTQIKVPLQRNGQFVSLRQSKFHVAIPFVYSSSGL